MLNNLENHEKMSSTVDFKHCNTNSNGVNYAEKAEHSKFWKAILNKDPFEKIKDMIEAGADLNEEGFKEDIEKDDNYDIINILFDHPDCLELLKQFVKHGYNVKKVLKDGVNVVTESIFCEDPRVFFYLYNLDQNIMLHSQGENEFDVIPLAAMGCKNTEIIKFLINKVSPIDKVYDHGWGLVHHATSNPNPEILQILIDSGASVDNNDYKELKPFKPLDYSIINDSDELKYLTPLALASQDGTPEVCEILIKAGARLEARDKGGRTPLMLATLNPNPEVFRLLLKYGADINALDYMKNTVLSYAIANSCFELVKEIADITKAHFGNFNYDNYIKNIAKAQNLRVRVEEDPDLLKTLQSIGIDPNLPKDNKKPLIFLAAKNPDLRVLDYLKEQGCDLSLGTEYESVLIYALQYNSNPEILDYLIKNNLFVKDITLAVEYIVRNPNVEVWKKLLGLGLPIDYLNNAGESLLMKYIMSNRSPNPDVVSLLTNDKTVNLKNNEGNTACHFAVDNEDSTCLSILLKSGAKISEKNNNGYTPLMIACSGMNSFELYPKNVDFLINNGADIFERDSEGNDALLLAMNKPNEEIIKLLIKKGADIHTKNRIGANILMNAVKNSANNEMLSLLFALKGENDDKEELNIDNNIDIIKYLISLGIDVNEKDAVGHPAITYAAFYNPDPRNLDLLIQNGADINYSTDKKENLLIIAARNNRNEKVIEYLLDKGFDKNYVTSEGETPILAASQNSNLVVLKKLIEKGANLEAIDNNKRNALFIAALCNPNPEVVSFIIDKGIPVNYRDPIGNTAVLYAAQNYNENVIKTLVKKGADLQAVNENGFTALMSAMSAGNNNVEVVKYLIENGIDVNAKDSDNITALMYASNSIINPEIIELLITAGADVSDEDVNGYNAYRIAKEYNPNPAIAETIRKYSLINHTKESILNIPTNVN